MNPLAFLLVTLALPQDPVDAPRALLVGPPERQLAGLAWGAGELAPVVVALGPRGRAPAEWGATRARLSALGCDVLALAPPEDEPFVAGDLDAALAHLHANGADTSRVAVLAWGDAAPAALEHALAQPGLTRGVTLLAPRFGAWELTRLSAWPATSLQLVESGTGLPVGGVLAAALPDEPQAWYRRVNLHGPVDPDTDACASAVAEHLAATLAPPDLVVPWFAADDERVGQPGFVSRTLRLTRTVPRAGAPPEEPAPRFVLMTYCVGDAFTLGMMTRQPFAGVVCFVAGPVSGSFAWDTETRTVGAVEATGAAVELAPAPAGFRDWHWTQLDLPREVVFQGARAELLVGFHPTGGAPVHLPGDELAFSARLSRR